MLLLFAKLRGLITFLRDLLHFWSYATRWPNLLFSVKKRRPHSKVAHSYIVDLNELVSVLLSQMTKIGVVLLILHVHHLVRICGRLLRDEGLISMVSQEIGSFRVIRLRLLLLHLR